MHQSLMESWPQRLARLRNAAGLTQAQVAEHFSIKPSSVAQWEGTGGRTTRPSIEKLSRLARLYGVSLETICGDDFPILAARRAESNSTMATLVQAELPPTFEDEGEFVKEPDIRVWVRMLRAMNREDRVLLAALVNRWVIRPDKAEKG